MRRRRTNVADKWARIGDGEKSGAFERRNPASQNDIYGRGHRALHETDEESDDDEHDVAYAGGEGRENGESWGDGHRDENDDLGADLEREPAGEDLTRERAEKYGRQNDALNAFGPVERGFLQIKIW